MRLRQDIIKRVLIGKNPRQTFIRTAITAISCIILFKFFLIPIRIQGISMEPTYHDGSVNFVNTLYYKFYNFKRGDIVAIAIGSGQHYMYLKRIVGMPNEEISFENDKLLVNGLVVQEPYVKYQSDWNMEKVFVGDNEYFVVGDNRSGPIDSHEKGRVYKTKIIGKPLW